MVLDIKRCLNNILNCILISLIIVQGVDWNVILQVSATEVIDNKWAAFLVGPYNPAYKEEAEAKAILTQLAKDSVVGSVAKESLNNKNNNAGKRFFSILNINKAPGIDATTAEVDSGGKHSKYANGDLTEIPNSYLKAMTNDMQKELGTNYGTYKGQGFGYRTFYQATYGGQKANLSSGYWGRTLGMFSEHCTGCAIDFAMSYAHNTGWEKEFQWLKENAHKYGFIWRYKVSGDKELKGGGTTGTIYEDWHWRFVGVYHATKFQEKCKGYTENTNYTWESYYKEYIQGKTGYPTSVYDAIVNIYPNDTSKCKYGESISNNSNNNATNMSNTNNTGTNLNGTQLTAMYKGDHGCEAEVNDLKAHNYPIFQQISEYIQSNPGGIQNIETWESIKGELLQQGSTTNNSSSGTIISSGNKDYKSYKGGVLDVNQFTTLIGEIAAAYCEVNPKYTSGGTSYTYKVNGKEYKADACCTTFVNLAWQVLGVNICSNSINYANNTDVRQKMQDIGFTYKKLKDMTDAEIEALPPGTIFISDGSLQAAHVEIFMGWTGNSSKQAFSYDSGGGAIGGHNGQRKVRQSYSTWKSGDTFTEPRADSSWSIKSIRNWYVCVYIPAGTYTGKKYTLSPLKDMEAVLNTKLNAPIKAKATATAGGDGIKSWITICNGTISTSNTGGIFGDGAAGGKNDPNDGLVGANDAEKCWNFLRSKGVSETYTAAILANIAGESSFNWMSKEGYITKPCTDPNMLPYSAGKGWGLIQWTHGNGVDACKIMNEAALFITNGAYDGESLRGQLEVVYATINVTEDKSDVYRHIYSKFGCNGMAYNHSVFQKKYGQKAKRANKSIYDYLNEDCSLVECVTAFHDCVEISAGGNASVAKRTPYAEALYKEFTGKPVPNAPTGGTGNTKAINSPYMKALEQFRTWINKQTDTTLKDIAKNIWYCWNDDGQGIDYHAGGGILFEDDPEIIIEPVEFLLTELSDGDRVRLEELKQELLIFSKSNKYKGINILMKVLGVILILYTILYIVAYLMDRSDIFVNSMTAIITFNKARYIHPSELELLTGDEDYKPITFRSFITTVIVSVVFCSLLISSENLIQIIYILYQAKK